MGLLGAHCKYPAVEWSEPFAETEPSGEHSDWQTAGNVQRLEARGSTRRINLAILRDVVTAGL
jgi:hypothetical protein